MSSRCNESDRRGLLSLWRWAAAVLVAVICALAQTASAQEARWGLQPNASREEISSALDILAKTPSLRPTDLDVVLTELGFSADLRPSGWKGLSERDKLHQAYRWARAVSDDNGRAFVVSAVKRFETRYESIAFDPLLGQFFSAPHAVPTVRFTAPTPTQLAEPLPREVVAVIDRLSRYTDAPGPLGRGTVARRHFGLQGDQLLDALQAREPREFLDQAARRATPPPPIHERINSLMQEVIRNSDAAANDAVLAAVAEQLVRKYGDPPGRHSPAVARAFTIDSTNRLRPEPPQSSGDSGGGGGGGGGTPERQQRAQQSHRTFESTHYPNPSSRTFRSAAGRAGGRGGVLAGSAVDGAALGQPKSLSIVLPRGAICASINQPAVFGDVLVRTSKGEYRYSHVRCDVLLAARKMVFEDLGGVAWKAGDALGLASVDMGTKMPTFPLFIPEGRGLGDVASRRGMVLHPALLDLPVGRSAAVLDLWPSAPVALLQATHENRNVARWLLAKKDLATWKWLDSPAKLSTSSGEISVVADGRPTLLAFRGFSDEEMFVERLGCGAVLGEKDFCERLRTAGTAGRLLPEFDAAAPLLVAHVAEFADTESLMRTLSLFRWARLGGVAVVTGDIPLPPSSNRARTPESLAISLSRDWIAAMTAQANWSADCQTFVARFDRARARARSSKSGYGEDGWIESVVLENLSRAGVISDDTDDKLQANCDSRK